MTTLGLTDPDPMQVARLCTREEFCELAGRAEWDHRTIELLLARPTFRGEIRIGPELLVIKN
jgi:hypothetical protein